MIDLVHLKVVGGFLILVRKEARYGDELPTNLQRRVKVMES